MNLLQNIDNEQNDITASNFRAYQYNQLDFFINLCSDYLKSHTYNQVYLSNLSRTIEEKLSYFGAFNSDIHEINVDVTDIHGKIKKFLRLYIPSLIHNNHFYLNGNYYTPTMYISDLPISIKKASIIVHGLFNSLTIYWKEDICILTGTNIPLSYFLQVLFKDDSETTLMYQDILTRYKKNHQTHTEENIIKYFKTNFTVGDTIDDIHQFIEKIIFDQYTKTLFEACYGTSNIVEIIKVSIKNYVSDDKIQFIDLNHKRVVFIEKLLEPLFSKIGGLVKSVSRGFLVDELRINQYAIIKWFTSSPDGAKGRKGLSGSFIYNTTNLFSGILQNKVSMTAPGVEHPPDEVKRIHPTFTEKICPITISSQKPGKIVSILPDVKLDCFGRFI